MLSLGSSSSSSGQQGLLFLRLQRCHRSKNKLYTMPHLRANTATIQSQASVGLEWHTFCGMLLAIAVFLCDPNFLDPGQVMYMALLHCLFDSLFVSL